MQSGPDKTYRSANDAPVPDAETVTDLAVSGKLPAPLSGQYVSVGEGMVYAVDLADGRARSYRHRSIPEDATDVIAFGSSILAFADGGLAYELGAGLDTIRRVDLAGARRSLIGRPRIDPLTGELHILTFAIARSQLHVVVSPGGLTRTIRSIDNAPSIVRQLELTRDHVVLVADGFLGVTDRAGMSATTTWFPIDTEARHIAMAHARGDSVVVHATGPSLVRWTLRRGTAIVHSQLLDPRSCLYATSNRGARDTVHRFLWTVGADAVHKQDLLTGIRRCHRFSGGTCPDEHLFVADPDRSRAEDGGWLIGFVHDEVAQQTDLVVLDAQAIELTALAIVRMPRPIAGGMRGAWIPTARI